MTEFEFNDILKDDVSLIDRAIIDYLPVCNEDRMKLSRL